MPDVFQLVIWILLMGGALLLLGWWIVCPFTEEGRRLRREEPGLFLAILVACLALVFAAGVMLTQGQAADARAQHEQRVEELLVEIRDDLASSTRR